MRVQDLSITFIDFEGTGSVSGLPDEPWQIGMVLFRDGGIVKESMVSRYLHVGDRPFNPYAPGRHAELRDELREAPRLPALWNDVRHWFGNDAIAAHNTATEKRYLRKAYPMMKLPPWIDTLTLARAAYPDLKSYALEDLIVSLALTDSLGTLVPRRAPHDALYDAVASALLFQTLVDSDAWNALSLDALLSVRR